MKQCLCAVAVSTVLTTMIAAQSGAQSQTSAQTASSAQSPSSPQPQSGTKTVVTGCVELPRVNGSIGGTGLGTSATSPNTADDDANSSRLSNTFVLTGATSVRSAGTSGSSATAGTAGSANVGAATATADADAGRPELTTYALEGHEAELRAQLGHRVEVSGTVAPPRDQSRANASGVSRLMVDAVRMVAATCGASSSGAGSVSEPPKR